MRAGACLSRGLLTAACLWCGLSAALQAQSDVRLTWNANSETDLSHYRLYRAASADLRPEDALLVADDLQGTATIETAVPIGTWYYRLVAVDAAGNASPPSDAAMVRIREHRRRIRVRVEPVPVEPPLMVVVMPGTLVVELDASGLASIADRDPDRTVSCALDRLATQDG